MAFGELDLPKYMSIMIDLGFTVEETDRLSYKFVQRYVALLMALAALVGLILIAVLAFYMMCPVTYAGLGRYATLALSFPLRLIVATAALGGLAVLSRVLRASVSTWLFELGAVLTALLAATPIVLLWLVAERAGIPVTFADGSYDAGVVNMSQPSLKRTVTFAHAADGTPLLLDHWPTRGRQASALRPAMILLHGGGWAVGQRSEAPRWDRWLNELGYDVFDVDYRMLTPEPWRDEVGDVKCAAGWIAAHAAENGIDPSQISLMGLSAGGNLALLSAYSGTDPKLPASCSGPTMTVRSVINLYGPSDMTSLYYSSGSWRYLQRLIRRYIGGSPSELPDRYRLLSPQMHVEPGVPPTILIAGETDRVVPVDQAKSLAHALEDAHVENELVTLPVTDHAFDLNWDGLATQIARAKIRAFLSKQSALSAFGK